MALLVVAAGCAIPAEALAVPPRRLARWGVVPPAGAPGAAPPAAVPAPVVVGPVLRPRRRALLQSGTPAAAGAPSVAGRQPAPAKTPSPAKTPTPAATPPAATAATSGKTTPQQVPNRRPALAPTPAGQPAMAGAAAAQLKLPASTTAESTAFTPEWYAKYPQAWRPTQSPTDWWRAADVATVTAWLAQPVTAAGNAATDSAAVTAAGGVGDDGLHSVLVLPAGHDNQTAATVADSDWLPLGVFAVTPPENAKLHTYQQLAVDRKGVIKGNFYDAISGTNQPIEGTVDRTTLMASWTVGTNGSRFTAPMRAFTSEPRTVSVASDGQSQSLAMMPMQRP